jgi:CRISPR/Cas system CSM-associated protein Csm3 (group 7 of RAMP superfamily)
MTITLMIAAIDIEPGWAVGTVTEADPAIDRDILLDASGQPWIPGSAPAGSLRAHLAAAKPPADVRLMGSRPPASQAESAQSTASPLWVLGAAFSPARSPAAPGDDEAQPSQVSIETTGQTAVDRVRGAAAAGSLRFSRLAASGGTLTVYLRHDEAGALLTQHDLTLIAAWQPAIGRDRTRGSGRASLAGIRYGTVDPATPAGAALWLTHDGPGLFEAVATQAIIGPAPEPPWLEARFEITDGLLIGTGRTEKTATTRKRDGQPLIPGSTWKGIIRSRTEFIIRSRYGPGAACQQQDGCGTCPACAVFGHQGQRGKLAFRDSSIEHPVPGSPADGDPVRTQVAIDRVTGGSRPGLLFQTAPVPAGHLQLRIDALAPVEPWVANAIRHVLRDIDDGLIGIGSRTTRGLGTLRLLDSPAQLEPVVIPELEDPAGPEART